MIKLGEKLKMEMRHSWLSNGRHESVAEHTWRVAFMAILLEPYLSQKVQMEKLLKMISIHDIIEAIAGDVPAFDTLTSQSTVESKRQKELAAIIEIRDSLPSEVGEHLFMLWHEFEEKQTFEAKVANALDKLEAQLQHNEAGIDTWLEIEFEMTFLLGKHVNFDETLTCLKDIIVNEAEDEMIKAGYDVDSFKQKAKVRS
ncbi:MULTISPECIES: HD domain-containing protein [Bacillus]|uniref:HD domain-containing protein n=1 Tax=Bacillus TaxID=1386 RepID=UPI000BB7D125|nr:MULTISPECIES: HD domain-containing protein [Bacillus]